MGSRCTLEKGEAEAGAALVKNLPNAEIVFLPDVSPGDYERAALGLTGSGKFGEPILSQTKNLRETWTENDKVEAGGADVSAR